VILKEHFGEWPSIEFAQHIDRGVAESAESAGQHDWYT
jgi:hypothetical protein